MSKAQPPSLIQSSLHYNRSMIQLKSLRLDNYPAEFYALSFHRVTFLLLPKPPLQSLKYFSKQQQTKLGKIKVKLNLEWLLSYPHFFSGINYVLLTQYQQILLLPYLLRQHPDLQILATTLMCEMAKIYLNALKQKVNQLDLTRQQISYHDEMQLLDSYQHEFDIQLDQWRDLYSTQEINHALDKIQKVNYHQIYNTERGLRLIPYPSGKNNASCFWEIHSLQTKEKVLLINDLSMQQWRTCQPYNPTRLQQSQQQKNYDYIIFTKKTLENIDQENEEVRVSDFLKRITANMNNGVNTSVILEDETIAVDLIPRLPMQPEGKCQAVILSHHSFHDITNFCNSYVDFLSNHFKNHIFSESPEYPLIHYCRLKEKGLISHGGLEQTAIRRKLPVKQIVLQNTPFIHFLNNYQYFLDDRELQFIGSQTKHEQIEFTVNNNFNQTLLREFMAIFKSSKIYAFNNIDESTCLSNGINFLNLNNSYQLNDSQIQRPIYLPVLNLGSKLFQRFKLTNNQLSMSKEETNLILLPHNYLQLLFNELIKKGINIIQKDNRQIRTHRSHIALSPTYTLKISTSSCEELLVTEACLNSISQKYALK